MNTSSHQLALCRARDYAGPGKPHVSLKSPTDSSPPTSPWPRSSPAAATSSSPAASGSCPCVKLEGKRVVNTYGGEESNEVPPGGGCFLSRFRLFTRSFQSSVPQEPPEEHSGGRGRGQAAPGEEGLPRGPQGFDERRDVPARQSGVRSQPDGGPGTAVQNEGPPEKRSEAAAAVSKLVCPKRDVADPTTGSGGGDVPAAAEKP